MVNSITHQSINQSIHQSTIAQSVKSSNQSSNLLINRAIDRWMTYLPIWIWGRKRGRPAKKVTKPAKRTSDGRKGNGGKMQKSGRTDTVDAPFESFRRKGNPPGVAYTPLVVTFGYENLRQEGKRWHCECRFCGITKSEGAGWHSGFRQHLKTHHRQIYDMYRENPHQPPPPADPYLPRPFACADCDAKWPTKKLLFLHIKVKMVCFFVFCIRSFLLPYYFLFFSNMLHFLCFNFQLIP